MKHLHNEHKQNTTVEPQKSRKLESVVRKKDFPAKPGTQCAVGAH